MPRWVVGALWALGSLVSVWTVARQLGVGGALYQRDFTSLWVAGNLALQGNFQAIYDIEAFRAATASHLGAEIPGNYAYPPFALLLAVPFGTLPYGLSYALWTVCGAALFMLAARPYWRLPLILVVLTPAALANARYGQYGFIYGALWLWAFSGARYAGLAAGALTFKPHLGLLAGLQMLRDRRALLLALLTAAVLVVVSLPIGWEGFLREAVANQSSIIGKSTYMRAMVPPVVGYGWAGHVAFAAAALFLLSRNFNAFTAATATFLIVPYGFPYDMTVVSLGFAVLLQDRWDELSPIHRLLACLGFLSPALVFFGPWLVPPILLAGLYVLVYHGDGYVCAGHVAGRGRGGGAYGARSILAARH